MALIDAVPPALVADHQVFVEDDGLGVVAGIQVVVTQIVHHLERLLVRTALVARDVVHEVVGLRGVTLQRVDRDDVAARRVGELARARELGVDDAELDRLLERVERLLELTLVPEDVAELVPGVAEHLVVRRRVLGHLGVRLRGEVPLAGIALRLVEEQLTEREVRVRDVLRLRRLLDEVVVDRTRVFEVVRLLVLVREVVEDLVDLPVVRVLVDDERVVGDRLLARGLHHRVGLVRLRLLLAGRVGVRLLQLVALHLRLRLVAERGGLELDVRLCEAARELRAIGLVLRGRLEETLEALDLGDEEGALASLEAALALVARSLLDVRLAGLRLLILLLQLSGLGRGVEVRRGRLAALELLRSDATGAGVERLLRLLVDADVGCERLGPDRDGGTDEQELKETTRGAAPTPPLRCRASPVVIRDH